MKIKAENFIERSDGAIVLTIDKSNIFFSHNKVIAVVTGGVLFRTHELDSGIVYKRIKAALGRQPVARVEQLTRPELMKMVDAIVVRAGSDLIDEQLLKENEK